MFKAIIFDFDYTLGDSTSGVVLSVNYALEKLGFDIKNKEEIRKTIGLSLRDTFSVLTGSDNGEEAEKFSKYFKEKADSVMVDNTELYDDVKIEKPNPEGLLWAVDNFQLEKDDILYVGDSLIDAKTAENAQINFAGVLTGTTGADEFKIHRNIFIGEQIRDVYEFIMNLPEVQEKYRNDRRI